MTYLSQNPTQTKGIFLFQMAYIFRSDENEMKNYKPNFQNYKVYKLAGKRILKYKIAGIQRNIAGNSSRTWLKSIVTL